MWVGLSQSVEGIHRTKNESSCNQGRTFLAWQLLAGTMVSSHLWTQMETFTLTESQGCLFLNWHLYHRLSWFSGLHTWTRTKPSALLGTQLANCRFWYISAYLRAKFLIINCVCVCVCVCTWLVAQSCLTHCVPKEYSLPGSFVHGDSPGKNTGVGFHLLLQGIIPT